MENEYTKQSLTGHLDISVRSGRGWAIRRGTEKPGLCPGKEGCRLRRCWWANMPPAWVNEAEVGESVKMGVVLACPTEAGQVGERSGREGAA